MTSTPTLFQLDFTLVVIGQIISLFGNAILRFALPLYLLRITGSPTLFGIVTACSFAPMVVLSLVGGVLADRVNKRDIMVVLDFSTAALIAIFTLLLDRAPLVPLFIIVLMFLYGISGTYQPAVQASIPLLVHPERLIAANAVINQVNTLSNLLGPVLGGVLFSLSGILPILLLSVVFFSSLLSWNVSFIFRTHHSHAKLVSLQSLAMIYPAAITLCARNALSFSQSLAWSPFSILCSQP